MVLAFSLAITAAVVLPWVLAARPVGAVVTGAVSFVFALIFVYIGLPSTAGPLWGGLGTIAVCFLFIAGIIAAFTAERRKDYIPLWAGLVSAGLYLLLLIGNSTVFRATEYAALVPQIE